MILTKALQKRFRALWFTTLTVTSMWFMFWILYDIFVWNKTITQVKPANYFGLITSTILLILDIKIGNSSIERILHLKQKSEKKPIIKTQAHQSKEEKQKQPIEQTQETQPTKKKENQVPRDTSIPPGCKFYLGYLHNYSVSVEIPEECLECGNVVNCISPTARSLKECENSKS